MKNAEIKLGETSVVREVSVGNVSNTEEKDTVSFFREFSEIAIMDTGLLPLEGTGLLMIRQALDHVQIVFQHAPGAYLINWGKYERDKSAKTYKLAQPWRIVVGDIVEGNLLGARTFYSPTPIQTMQQPLYHANVPNLNCRGYRGNGVGWLCLYRTQDWTNYPLSDKIRKLVERTSGVETYNDANMSETDGPRFYQSHKRPDYTWNPQVWQDKTEKEGCNWTLEEGLWIPIQVKDADHQDKHYDGGVQYTLEMATEGRYSSYYGDKYLPKPVNAFCAEEEDEPETSVIHMHMNKAFAKAAQPTDGPKKSTAKKKTTIQEEVAAQPIQPIGGGFNQQPAWTPPPPKCVCCSTATNAVTIPEGEAIQTMDGKICKDCSESCYAKCAGCSNFIHVDNIQLLKADDKKYCKSCKTIYTCKNCGEQSLYGSDIIETDYCIKCATAGSCAKCDKTINLDNAKHVETALPWDLSASNQVKLCLDCFSTSVLCGCKLLQDQDDVGLMGDGIYACGGCIGYKDDGTPYYAGKQQVQEVKIAEKPKTIEIPAAANTLAQDDYGDTLAHANDYFFVNDSI